MPARDPNQLDLRRAIHAPPNHLILVIDSKQIQCRLLNYLAGEEWVIEVFRDPTRDLYAETASVFYKKPIDKKTHPLERYVGKKIELGCQFGQGWRKFQRLMGVGADGPRVVLSDSEAHDGIDSYRGTHRRVCNYWGEAGNNHAWLAGGLQREWGPMEIKDKKIYMPDGTFILYDTMEWHQERDEDGDPTGEDYWRYRTRRGWTKTYGAAMVENCMQALERCFMVGVQKRLAREGVHAVNVEHDKLALIVKNNGTENQVKDFCVAEFKRVPDWLPGMPLDADWYMGERYEAPLEE
jgi:DNA polymerase